MEVVCGMNEGGQNPDEANSGNVSIPWCKGRNRPEEKGPAERNAL
jgi:hypothetical protein